MEEGPVQTADEAGTPLAAAETLPAETRAGQVETRLAAAAAAAAEVVEELAVAGSQAEEVRRVRQESLAVAAAAAAAVAVGESPSEEEEEAGIAAAGKRRVGVGSRPAAEGSRPAGEARTRFEEVGQSLLVVVVVVAVVVEEGEERIQAGAGEDPAEDPAGEEERIQAGAESPAVEVVQQTLLAAVAAETCLEAEADPGVACACRHPSWRASWEGEAAGPSAVSWVACPLASSCAGRGARGDEWMSECVSD